MSAPLIWILLPAVLAATTLLISNQRILAIGGGSLASLLALIALFLPNFQSVEPDL